MDQRTAFGTLIVGTYAVYMLCHVAQGTLAPDGIILSGVIGTLAALIGVHVGVKRTQNNLPNEDPEEPLEPSE